MIRKKLKSVTLIETIMYVALASVIVLTVSYLLITVMQIKTKSKIILEVESQGLQVVGSLNQSIRNARGVTAPVVGATGSTLTLVSDTPAKNPTAFQTSGDTINILEGTGSPIALTSSTVKIFDVSFSNLNFASGVPAEIKIQFTLKSSYSEPGYEFNYQKTFYTTTSLRNFP